MVAQLVSVVYLVPCIVIRYDCDTERISHKDVARTDPNFMASLSQATGRHMCFVVRPSTNLRVKTKA